jgi:hypothetical protein
MDTVADTARALVRAEAVWTLKVGYPCPHGALPSQTLCPHPISNNCRRKISAQIGNILLLFFAFENDFDTPSHILESNCSTMSFSAVSESIRIRNQYAF